MHLSIRRMMDPIIRRYIFKIERIHTFKAPDVIAILMGIGAALMVCINTAVRAKIMLRGFGVECIEL